VEVEEFYIENKEFVDKWQEFFDHHVGKKIEFGRHLKYGYDRENHSWTQMPGITHIYISEPSNTPHWMRQYAEALCGTGKGPSYKFQTSDTPELAEAGMCPRCEQRMRGFIKRLKAEAKKNA